MNSRWTQEGAASAVDRWADDRGRAMALRFYTARLIGEEPNLVLHGGGNVSLKAPHRTLLGDEVEAIFVKGSGRNLAGLDVEGLPGMDVTHLRRLQALDSLPDETMVNEIRRRLFDTSAPTPSIETLVHAFLPHRYVDHSHADAILALTNQPDPERLVREALGSRVAIIPYVRPGFHLAKAVAAAWAANRDLEGIVLAHHGLVTFGDDAQTSYERHIALVDACERFIAGRRETYKPASIFSSNAAPAELAARVAPVLRGLLAHRVDDEDRPFVRPILEWRSSNDVLTILNSDRAEALAKSAALTGDHLIRTKPLPMFVASPAWDDEEALRTQLTEAVEAYRQDYVAYVERHRGSTAGLDANPRVVWLPGAGLLCWGPTKTAACITADIAEHTVRAKTDADAIGTYTALSADHLFDMEFRGQQRAKIREVDTRPLGGQVVVVSGGAGAIGVGVAEACLAAGAHVALTDIDEARLAAAVSRLAETFDSRRVTGVVMNVTDEASVRDGYRSIVQTFGGVDVVVPNAGIAHVAAIDQLGVADFRRVLEVNTVGYLLFMQEGIRLLKRQGLGGHVVINASKNVFAPGKQFAAYSASKAAGHQLGKVAAIECAPHGIRVNMINADAIFGDASTPSGLWAEVGPDRARSRNMGVEDLPEYYRGRNLLQTRVYGRHVGNAVVFFASNATPTTGATLPVDGGITEAFPR